MTSVRRILVCSLISLAAAVTPEEHDPHYYDDVSERVAIMRIYCFP